jgi:hypothetical protein
MKFCALALALLIFIHVNGEPVMNNKKPSGLRIAGMSPYLVAAMAAVCITGCVMRRKSKEENDSPE